jgi:hypothetical protein
MSDRPASAGSLSRQGVDAMLNREPGPTIHIPGTTSHTINPRGGRHSREGTLRYLKAGTGAPLVLLHTVRTQGKHFRSLIPLISDQYTVYALDLPERVRRVVAVNTYDFRGGIARSGLLARVVIGAVLAPGVGPVVAGVEPKAVLHRILKGGLGDKTALRADYVNELLQVGSRPGYPTVARAVYQNLPSLIAARSRYPEVKAPIHLVYGEKDWSRRSDREANKELLPAADFTQVPGAGHFIALERPDVLANLLNAVA